MYLLMLWHYYRGNTVKMTIISLILPQGRKSVSAHNRVVIPYENPINTL